MVPSIPANSNNFQQLIILSKQLYLQVTILKKNNLHTVVGYQVFLSITNIFQTDLFDQ